MTSVARTLAEGCALLRETSGSARADALLLLERALHRTRAWIVAYGEASVEPQAAHRFRELCQRRSAGIPTAYLLNSAGFCGREFYVDESVLIPRPETEHLVEEAIAYLGQRPGRVLDVGTGSGAIACAIAAQSKARVEGTEVSQAAIDVATRNASRLGVADRCRFHRGDLTAPVRDLRFDVVVANLPYVPTADLPRRPDPVAFEPREAVDGGPDGLTLYRRLLKELPPLLNPNALVLLEAAPPTIDALHDLVRASLPDFTISARNDYAGLARYVRAQRGA